MLEYIKTILIKVSFDIKLFEKELRKSLKMLVPQEMLELKEWCLQKFSEIYHRIINKVFAKTELST